MNSRRSLSLGAVALVVLFLAACGSSGGGLGGIFGGGGSNSSTSEVRGTVDYVDLNNRSIVLTNVSGYNNMLSSGGGNGSSLRVYFDNNTQVSYQGRTYNVSDLERGDQVSAQVEQSGNNLVATSLQVTYDAGAGRTGTYPTSGSSGVYGNSTTVRGTVRYIDTSRRTIELDRGYSTTTILEYDPNTYVTYGNRQFQVADLERGDEIEIRATDMGNGRLIANNVDVLRSVNNPTSTSGSTNTNGYSTVRGTVRSHDPNRRVIELESTNWISRFDTGSGSYGGGILTVQYGSGATIDVNGRMETLSGLERGDVIEVQTRDNTTGSTIFADRLMLVRDVNLR